MHLPNLTNLHWSCYHHSPVGRVLSLTALRQLSLCILDCLSDSSVIYTAESGLWFFVLSFLTLVSHLLPLGCDTGGRVMLHSGLISSNSTHTFPSLFPNLHFFFPLLSYRLTSGSGHFLLGWWQLSQLRNSYCRTLPWPRPRHPSCQWSFSPLFPLPPSPSLCTED